MQNLIARNDGNICHTERSEVSLKNIDCHDSTLRAEFRNDKNNGLPSVASNARNDGSANSRNDRIFPSIAEDFASYPHSIAELQISYSPSLAEGARGWVSLDSTSKTKSKNANIPHPKPLPQGEGAFNPSSKSSLRASNASVAIHNSSKVDCHDSTLRAESRNDKNNGLPRATSCARNDGNICHTERSEVSLKNMDCHADFVKSARNDKNTCRTKISQETKATLNRLQTRDILVWDKNLVLQVFEIKNPC